MSYITDVIAAISTPPGKGGVAVIRVSGNGAVELIEKCFFPASKKRLSDYPQRMQVYGYIKERGDKIDDVLCCYFKAPKSYTGEDTVEISCHGGVLVTRCVLELILSLGARAADAGEFTRRAFLSGSLSLTEAEAISTILEARTETQLKLSQGPSRDKLAKRVDNIRKSIVDIMSSIYARIDYPDEDLGDYTDSELLDKLRDIKENLSRLLSTYRTGRAINEGVRTVIVGKPNVGKSSLYNLLVGDDAAIVTDIAGTTRDVLVRSVPLGNALLELCDTAGIRSKATDAVEEIGITKSRKMMSECELLLAVFDISREFDNEDKALLQEISSIEATKIAILNKSDMPQVFDEGELSYHFDSIITVSANDEADTVEKLSELINRYFTDEKIIASADAIVATARQHASLTRACEFISLSIDSIEGGFSQDAVSSDIERALGAISELDGRAVSEEVVNDIFAKFCVGK